MSQYCNIPAPGMGLPAEGVTGAIDSFVNQYLQPSSVPLGISTAVLGFFSSKLAPKLPESWYKILDNPLFRIIACFLLINNQLRKPTIAILISVALVFGVQLYVHFFAPDTPPLSEILVEQQQKKDDGAKPPVCNCYCNSTLPPGSESK